MPCTAPIRGKRGADGVVRLLRGVPDARLFGVGKNPELELPCGRCMDCKIRRSTDWATRATHEAAQYEENAFITLTFSDDGLALRELQRGTHPFDLDVRDWQLFAKRLRKELKKQSKKPLRFFQVGEYGDQEARPHYHALIFGNHFREAGMVEWVDENGNQKWTSPTIEKAWGYGFVEIGHLTPETVNYVCNYVTKKLYGKMKEKACERIDCASGECVTVRPELATMSRRPGIGARHYEKFKNEIFPDDFVVVKGKKKPVPRYYYQKLKTENEKLAEQVRDERCKSAAGHAADNTPERRLVKGEVTKARVGQAKKRKL